jgi:hypothetical protein
VDNHLFLGSLVQCRKALRLHVQHDTILPAILYQLRGILNCRESRSVWRPLFQRKLSTVLYMITWAEMRYTEPLHALLAIILVTVGREGFDMFKHRRGKVSFQS